MLETLNERCHFPRHPLPWRQVLRRAAGHGVFPADRICCEPFSGAAGVLMQKPRAYSQIYNDLDGDLVNLFCIMQNYTLREKLTELRVTHPYAVFLPCLTPVTE